MPLCELGAIFVSWCFTLASLTNVDELMESTIDLLLTGFGPFRDIAINPSQLMAERLDGARIGAVRITSLILPVVFGQDRDLIGAAIGRHRPAIVLSLGVAAREPGLRWESMGRNRRQSEEGFRPILADGPDAYSSTIPHGPILAAVEAADVAIRLSDDAGTYLCNHLLYTTLHLASHGTHRFRAAFLHIPRATEHARPDESSMPLDTIERGIRAAIQGLQLSHRTA